MICLKKQFPPTNIHTRISASRLSHTSLGRRSILSVLWFDLFFIALRKRGKHLFKIDDCSNIANYNDECGSRHMNPITRLPKCKLAYCNSLYWLSLWFVLYLCFIEKNQAVVRDCCFRFGLYLHSMFVLYLKRIKLVLIVIVLLRWFSVAVRGIQLLHCPEYA